MSDWTHLVGIPGEDAKNIILTEDSTLNVIVLPENSPVTRDYRLDRVRVFVNSEGKVSHVPRKG